MKDRGYLEQLISKGLDEPLSELEFAELKEALHSDPELVDFQLELLRQATAIRTLPQLELEQSLNVLPEVNKATESAPSWWSRRLSTPWPIAAGVALLLLGIGFFGKAANPVGPIPTAASVVQSVQYDQTVRLQPTHAVVLDKAKTSEPAEEDTL